MVLLFYTTYICVDLAHGELLRAKVGKGGIICDKYLTSRAGLSMLIPPLLKPRGGRASCKDYFINVTISFYHVISKKKKHRQ